MAQESTKCWSEFARKALELSGVSQSELARRLSAKLDRTITQGAIQSRLANPNGMPPTDTELTVWADALRLDGFHRDQFIRLAYLERTHPAIKRELLAIESRLEKSHIKIAKLENENVSLRERVSTLESQLAEAAAEAAKLLL